jgi:hypothetical protein
MKLLRRFFGRSVVDHCVPRGIVPRHGIGRSLFRWAQKRRDLHLAASHPLYEIINRQPFNSTYALNSGTMAWLWHYIHQVRPQCILEMGSGRSTAMFSLYSLNQQERGYSTPIVVSLEHDEEWFGHSARLLKDLGTDHLVRLILAPIRGREQPELRYGIDSNQLRDVLGDQKIDLLLIDGPPGKEVGRQNTLPFALPFLADNADVFLDDAERESEKAIFANWRRWFADSLKYQGTLPLGPGLCWLKALNRKRISTGHHSSAFSSLIAG